MVLAGLKPAQTRHGFTLVELLLTVGLLLLLLGAVIFNFSTLQRGAALEDGANQMEALLRFARAQAAGTGRQVQIRFDEDVGDGLSVPLGRLQVLWEPDPVARPGFFEPLPEAASYVRGITERISIEEVRPGFTAEPRSASAVLPGLIRSSGPAAAPGVSSGTAPESAAREEEQNGTGSFMPIFFYPDGSADSAEIIVSARDEEENRLMAIQFSGMTGTMRRRLVDASAPSLASESEDRAAELEDVSTK